LIGAAPSSLSFHLKEMSHASLVTARQEGRFVIYSANYVTMNGLIAFLTENCCGGNPCGPSAMPALGGKCC
jgi:ArsR family transcriptional regulator